MAAHGKGAENGRPESVGVVTPIKSQLDAARVDGVRNPEGAPRSHLDASRSDAPPRSHLDNILPPVKPVDDDTCGDEEAGDGKFSAKQHQFSLSFLMADGTVPGALYHNFRGAPWRNKWKGATEVRVYFGGYVMCEVEGGEMVDTAGEWVAIIKGERLDKMHEELREGRRISIRVCRSPKERDGAVVESIQIRELEG